MELTHLRQMAVQWIPFAARTAVYGTISLVLGPLTSDHRASHWAMRRWCERNAMALGLVVQVEGLEHVPPEGAFVYAANHQSLMDVLALGIVLPGDFRWAAKRELLRVPFVGWHLRLAGHVAVERGGGHDAATRVIERFIEVLRSGKPLLVFPEGTRTPDGDVHDFKVGSFLAAVRAASPVLPVALEGTWRLLPPGAWCVPPDPKRIIRVRIGAPLSPVENADERDRVADLRDRCRAAVQQMHTLILEEEHLYRGDDASQLRPNNPAQRASTAPPV